MPAANEGLLASRAALHFHGIGPASAHWQFGLKALTQRQSTLTAASGRSYAVAMIAYFQLKPPRLGTTLLATPRADVFHGRQEPDHIC